ncbi:hypothetical protein SGFS_041170 [Streptomyces graminofaciens]|uniref:NACHT domain-containing protein n=1 Tax=Streptomyces graminofaciens TaxID=68212 RepID=A0ABM7F9Z4_9ACTN|nr:NACHT domain-containing protein [Streptomyces graminofaciens]BBC32823.1 hypothetical protein SGFS_041170 [Streptomyces graminofaciens]
MSGQIDTLLPYGVGAVAFLALLFFFARPFLTTLAGDAAKATPGAVRRLYRRLRPVGGRKLRRYRNQVRTENSKVRLGLSPSGREGGGGHGTPGLRDVYVPLQCEQNGGRTDAATLLREHHRTVLLGAPGAGKSLLLKHEMLEWADGEDDKALPVIVELHACNTAQRPDDARGLFEWLITGKFAKAGISTAREMVESRLDSGGLRVFFDGLDEVGTEHFERAVRELREFAIRYGDCDMVVSCRSAAYDGQLQDVFEQEIRIAEFDDASILRFLSKWPELTDPVMAARIFQALQDDPELMVLARSPLMLTMIAYLQSGDRAESVGPLPNSRAAFYDMAVAHLLDRDRLLNRSEAIGVYNAGRKTLVLQRLALRQLSTSSARGDRQEITRERFERVIDELLPGFDLERSPHLQRMLAEIVHRSELIKDIDRGRHYQFTHLTLLEYLAACELRGDEQRLMEYYRRDPTPWRETVRMWCAVTRGSCTQVVREVFEDTDIRRQVLALQCLADTVHIEEELAEEVLAFFLGRLGAAGDVEGDVSKGLGILAASSGLRGRRVREALIAAARGPVSARRSAAIRALVVSGRQEAATALAWLEDDEARAALQAMGDVAVPSLAQVAEHGEVWAVRSLGSVGTPAAAVRLAGLLWAERIRRANGAEVAATAAWQLASLIRTPEVLSALAEWAPRSDVHHPYDWVWEPFQREKSLTVVVGRIAELMRTGVPSAWSGVTSIDPRIGIPLFACADFGRFGPGIPMGEIDHVLGEVQSVIPTVPGLPNQRPDARRRVTIARLFDSDAAVAPSGRRTLEPLRDALLTAHSVSAAQRAVLAALPWQAQTRLLGARFGSGASDTRGFRTKWRQVREEPDAPVALKGLAWTTGTLLALLTLVLGGTRLVSGAFAWAPWGMEPWGPRSLATAVLITMVAAMAGLARATGDGTIALLVVTEGVCATHLFWLTLASGRDLFGWPVALLVMGSLTLTTVAAALRAARITAKIDNPLRDALAAAE